MPKKEKKPEGEKAIEKDLLDYLSSIGIDARSQVRTDYGVADVVTDKCVYEIKTGLSTNKLSQALGQVLCLRQYLGLHLHPVILGIGPHAQRMEWMIRKEFGVYIAHWDNRAGEPSIIVPHLELGVKMGAVCPNCGNVVCREEVEPATGPVDPPAKRLAFRNGTSYWMNVPPGPGRANRKNPTA